MFNDFANQWTPVLPASEVTKAPQRLVVAGENLVAWRDDSQQINVLLDRCPHRSVSLSLGRRTEEGLLACRFHGWEFGGDGACTHVPFNPDAPRHRLGAVEVPHRDLGGLLWVFTGFEPDSEPHFPASLVDPSLTRYGTGRSGIATRRGPWWTCSTTPACPHVHRTTIGRFVRAKQTRQSRLHFDLEATDYGFGMKTRLDDNPPAELHWYRPNSMVLDVAPAPRLMRLQIYCIPTALNRTGCCW